MLISQDQSQQITQTQRIAPHLIQASELLQCSSVELTQAIERELMENPALEATDASADLCPGCPATKIGCPRCPFTGQSAGTAAIAGATFTEMVTEGPAETAQTEPQDEPEAVDGWAYDDGSYYLDGQEQAVVADDVFDPLNYVTTPTDLSNQLLSLMRSMAADADDIRVAEYLVACLDERGWLKIEVAEASDELAVGVDRIEDGIKRLQSCDPPGIGARDLQECLLLQLSQLDEDGRGHPLLKRMISKHWLDVVQRRHSVLARRNGVAVEEIEAAIHFLQTELSPNPASVFRDPWANRPDDKSGAIRPDVLIKRTATGFDVEVLGFDSPNLHINARYRALYDLLKGPAAEMPAAKREERMRVSAKLSTQERHHIVQFVDRANLFLKNIEQRKRTIERITRRLIEAQQGFIETGSRAFLRPMTRTELAQQSGVHESTVSRALLRKFVQLPNQDVLAYDDFFVAAASVKDMIENLIANEDPASPYSDEKIRQILVESGHDIARRTVVKYREAMRIPASYLRRKH